MFSQQIIRTKLKTKHGRRQIIETTPACLVQIEPTKKLMQYENTHVILLFFLWWVGWGARLHIHKCMDIVARDSPALALAAGNRGDAGCGHGDNDGTVALLMEIAR